MRGSQIACDTPDVILSARSPIHFISLTSPSASPRWETISFINTHIHVYMYISSRRIFKGVATLSHRRKDSSSHSIKSALLRLVWAVQINQGHPVPPGSCVKVSHLTALKLANNKGLVGKRQYGRVPSFSGCQLIVICFSSEMLCFYHVPRCTACHPIVFPRGKHSWSVET